MLHPNEPRFLDDAPKRVTAHHAVVAELATTSKGFHPEPSHGEDTHNDAPKRVVVQTRTTIAGAEARSFRSNPHPCHLRYQGRSKPKDESPCQHEASSS